ncbi:MAG: hypothetical protein MZV70_57155 [Desulfobacterales bacterium]|nr:hypothetical protein [Desulfobacterales bacterium]
MTGPASWTRKSCLRRKTLPRDSSARPTTAPLAKDHPQILSSSWYWPERAERIAQMASATDQAYG